MVTTRGTDAKGLNARQRATSRGGRDRPESTPTPDLNVIRQSSPPRPIGGFLTSLIGSNTSQSKPCSDSSPGPSGTTRISPGSDIRGMTAILAAVDHIAATTTASAPTTSLAGPPEDQNKTGNVATSTTPAPPEGEIKEGETVGVITAGDPPACAAIDDEGKVDGALEGQHVEEEEARKFVVPDLNLSPPHED